MNGISKLCDHFLLIALLHITFYSEALAESRLSKYVKFMFTDATQKNSPHPSVSFSKQNEIEIASYSVANRQQTKDRERDTLRPRLMKDFTEPLNRVEQQITLLNYRFVLGVLQSRPIRFHDPIHLID